MSQLSLLFGGEEFVSQQFTSFPFLFGFLLVWGTDPQYIESGEGFL